MTYISYNIYIVIPVYIAYNILLVFQMSIMNATSIDTIFQRASVALATAEAVSFLPSSSLLLLFEPFF